MKKQETIIKQIMKFCPHKWAKDPEQVRTSLGYWLKEDDMWGKGLGWQTRGFIFKKTKSGRRYMETLPVKIYLD